jgi:hypothetical protein
MRLSQWLARFLASERTSASGRIRRPTPSTAPSLYLRRLEDRRVLSVDVVDSQVFGIAENSANNTVVGTVQVTQTPPAQALTYSITDGNTSNAFLINPTTGEIRVNNTAALDFETTPAWNLLIRAQLTADSNTFDTSIVRINLSDVATAQTATMTGPAATMSLVGDRIQINQAGTLIFNQQKGDVSTLTVNGSSAANTLTIDFSGGNPIPTGGLTYDGLAPSTIPGDALQLLGGSFTTAVYTYTNANSGTIALTGGLTAPGITSTITYRNLEPIVNTGTAANIELILSGSNDDAVLEDLGGGMLRLRSSNALLPTFEATTFAAPTSSLTVRGGAGNDTITVTPLSGAFTLSIDGGVGTNSLVVDQLNTAVAAANEFRFAGYTFDQTNTPDQLTAFTSGTTPAGQSQVTVNSAVGSPTSSANFPLAPFGFNSALTIGRLANLTLTSGNLALNMPSGNNGALNRSGFELSWSGGRTLENEAGSDFVIYEASSAVGTQDAAMIQVHVVGVGWTKWYYQTKDTRESYPGSGEGAYATAIDLTNLGVAAGATIDKIRYVNMIAADRMEGPGTEKVVGSGIFFATGFVIPGDGGATSDVLPDPGANANYNYFGSTTLDPDPLYFGVLHPLASPSAAGPGNDEIAVTGTNVAVTVDGSAKVTIGYASMTNLRVNTRDGVDTVSVALESTLPTNITVDGGAATDQTTLVGTTGAQSVSLTGRTAKVDGKTITFSNVEQLTVDTQAAGAGDTVTVDGTFYLAGDAPSLNVVSGGAAVQNDQLIVTRAPQLYTVGSVTFDQAATPNVYSDLPLMALDGGHGVVVNTTPDKTTSGTSSLSSGFPTAVAGFDYSLSLGAQIARDTAPTTVRFFGLPDSTNNGTTRRSGFSLSWSDDRVMRNSAGTSEFVLYESGSTGVPEPVMVQVRNAVTGVWSDWIYKPASSSSAISGGVAFATVYDLSDFGLAIGDTVDAVRVVNIINADRMQDSSGVGIVLPGETSPTSTFRPSPGPLASATTFPTGSLDPDPIYFGALHGTVYDVSLDPDSVDFTGSMPINYSGLAKVTVETGGDSDTLAITPSTETEYVVRGGFPLISTNPGDEAALVLAGVTDPTFTVGTLDPSGHTTGTLTSTTHKSVTFTGIDRFTADLTMDVVVSATANDAVGTDVFLVTRNADDSELFVNGKLVFRAEYDALDHLQVNGSADIDQLTVELAAGNSIPGGGIGFGAADGDDKLTVQGTTATDDDHTIDNDTDGSIDLDGSLIEYTGTETIVDTIAATNRSFTFTDSFNVLTLEDDADAGLMAFSGDGTPLIRFAVPNESLDVLLGPDDDELEIASVDGAFVAALSIDGETGYDVVIVNAALTLGSVASTGDLAITADSIELHQPINTTGGLVGDVTFTVGDLLVIDDAATIFALGDVLIQDDGATAGLGRVEAAGDITTIGGDVTIETPTLLTDAVQFVSVLGDISFSGTDATLDGNFDLILQADLGTITFDADAGFNESLAYVQMSAAQVVAAGVLYSEVPLGSFFGVIIIRTDDLVIDPTTGGLFAGDGLIEISTLTDGRELTLGDDGPLDVLPPFGPTTLALNEDELLYIAADTLRFGDDRSGTITVLNLPTLPFVSILHLETGAGITGAGSISVESLALTAVDDIALTGIHDVDFFAAEVTGPGSGVSFTDGDVLVVDLIDGVAGVSTNGGLAELIVGLGLTQTTDGDIVSERLRFATLGLPFTALVFLPNSGNDADVLSAAIDGDLLYNDADGLSIGSATVAEGITTGGGSLLIQTADTLNLYEAIDAGVGTVSLISDQAIEDIGPTGPKIIADTFGFLTATGLGNSGPVGTSVGFLVGLNQFSGTINIADTSGALLTIDTLGLTNESPSSLGGAGITLSHVGELDIAGPVTSLEGTIDLSTTGGDLIVNAPVLLSGGAGDIVFTAGGDLVVRDTGEQFDIRTTGSGSIIGRAPAGVVTIEPDVIIRSATGMITNIPPQLSNVFAPQIQNTGFAVVTFDYGRLDEFNFTAVVDWADGDFDVLGLGSPGSSGSTHVYAGNPNLSDPAAPIPITVTLRSDDRIIFQGYETTSITVLVDFPGDGVRNVRIDTTPKVPQLAPPPPARIVDVQRSISVSIARANVSGGAGLVSGKERAAERILILVEVLPGGREGTSARFNQDKLKNLEEVFGKLRNGRYRLYLFEPDLKKMRLVMDVYVRDGKPTAVGEIRDDREARPDGAQLQHPANEAMPTPGSSAGAIAAEVESAGEFTAEEEAEVEPEPVAANASVAAGAAGVGFAALAGRPWHEQVEAALAKPRGSSRVRSSFLARRVSKGARSRSDAPDRDSQLPR